MLKIKQERNMGKDKFLHFGVSCVATLVCGFCMFFLGKAGAILCGAWFGVGLGLGKEYGDSKASGNYWDWFDILADGVGILVGVGVLAIFLR